MICFVGLGRRRRDEQSRNRTEYTKFKENIEYTVIMPGEYDDALRYQQNPEQCKNFVVISGLLAALLALSTVIVSRRCGKFKSRMLFKCKIRFILNSSDMWTGIAHARQRQEEHR